VGLCRCPERLASSPKVSIVTEHRRPAVLEHQISFAARSFILKYLYYKSSIWSPASFAASHAVVLSHKNLFLLLESPFCLTVFLPEHWSPMLSIDGCTVARVSVTLECFSSGLWLLRVCASWWCQSRSEIMSVIETGGIWGKRRSYSVCISLGLPGIPIPPQ